MSGPDGITTSALPDLGPVHEKTKFVVDHDGTGVVSGLALREFIAVPILADFLDPRGFVVFPNGFTVVWQKLSITTTTNWIFPRIFAELYGVIGMAADGSAAIVSAEPDPEVGVQVAVKVFDAAGAPTTADVIVLAWGKDAGV